MGTRALGMRLAEKTLRDRVSREGQDKDPREACVQVPTNWEKRERQGPEEHPALLDSALSRGVWTGQSPEAPSNSGDSVRLEEGASGGKLGLETGTGNRSEQALQFGDEY